MPRPATPPFQILEHPADLGLRVFGATLAALFENAALALLSVTSEPAGVDPRAPYPLQAAAPDTESLLVAWLNEVLYWFDGKRIAFHHFHVLSIGPDRLAAEGFGEPRDSLRHTPKLIVKAVTWHQLRVAQEAGRWIAEVYLDV